MFKYFVKQSTKFLLILLICLVFLFLPSIINVNAETIETSDVITDLSKDNTFKMEDYPTMTYEYYTQINNDKDENNNQEMIEIISIAETENKKLCIYTYPKI